MSNHTPGPWVVVYSKNGYPYQIDAPNGSKGKGGITSITRWGGISFPSSDEGEANARLIAAAPELLAALRSIESGLPAGSSLIDGANPLWRDAYRDLQRIARAAIVKAEGKS